jgi:hypothetical protein
MPSIDKIAEISAKIETREIQKEKKEKKTFLDYFSIAFTTFGVGFIRSHPERGVRRSAV